MKDKVGKLKLPIVTVNRDSVTKDPAFNVILPDDGKEKLYMIGVVVKGYNTETAIANFGQAKLYGTYFTLTEVEEFEDDEGRIAFRPKDESVN